MGTVWETERKLRSMGRIRWFGDTDQDGLRDGEEVNEHKTSALDPDTDGDGLTDGEELERYKTDPNVGDSDGDGLGDGDEVIVLDTNPLLQDTNGDGIIDGDEDSDSDKLSDADEINIHNTNPKIVDSDLDGLSDGDEVFIHKTKPNVADSDGDGLSDGQEVVEHGTNPLLGDTDGDGLGDGEEVEEHGTNPLLGDTDRDGSLDLIEVQAGTDPNNPFEYPATRYNPDIGGRPAITVPPDDEKVILGGTALFKVEARNGTLNYRWIKLGEGAIGTNQNALRIDNVGHNDIGFYVVIVSNKFGTVYSKTVRLDLITKPGKPRLNIIFISGKRLIIEVTGDSLHTYEIQHSRDLKEWRPLAYNPLKTNDRGKTRLELNLSPESMHGFFRLIE